MPAAELELTPDLATRLLTEQHPDLANLAMTPLSRGWDNTMFRLGEELTIRLPRRPLAEQLLIAEQRWLPELGPRLPLPVPIPVRAGTPTDYYPWHWSVLPFFPGRPVGAEPDLDRPTAADDLGNFCAALHTPAPSDAPENTGRGVPLAVRDEATNRYLDAIADDASTFTDAECRELKSRWARYLTLPDWGGRPMWLHGDLHAMNVLHHNRQLSAVIDFGDITSGDPATDLAIGYALFDDGDRDRFRAAADSPVRPIDDATWERAEAWAMSIGLAIINSSADSPDMFGLGRRMLNLA